MKIYFTASARGTSEYVDNYREIYNFIKELGHTNTDDLVLDVDTDAFYKGSHEDQVALYDKTVKLIAGCDVVVLEVSVHSLSMGYVMQKALEIGKPVIALYLPDRQPYFALGIEDDKLQVVEYTKADLKETLKMALDYASERQDTRFNFFVSPRHQHYLDWISRKRMVPRAVHLRKLLERDMDENKEYQADLIGVKTDKKTK